ncbi:unnamed protein product [Somion occarium]|uniref:Major facilitator superfamily (MFS) profile domain-containing protein n=1 Tax=Somion occarium TaxID=3059160 RepID=A0ABP1CX61_9APHY
MSELDSNLYSDTGRPGVTDVDLEHASPNEKDVSEDTVVSLSLKQTPQDPPEGGVRAWLTVIGCSFVMFISFGMIQSFGVFQDYYTRVVLSGFSPSDISWIGSVQTFLLYALGLYTGKWFDNGYFYFMIIPGSIIYIISIFMLSLCKPQHYYQFFLSQGLGMGIGMGLVTVPCISIISHYFQTRRARANGIVFAGSTLGGLLWPIMLNRLILHDVGFAWGVRITAFLCFALLFSANLLMRTRPPAIRPARTPMVKGLKVAFSDLPFNLCLVAVFITGLGLFFPFNYLELFASLHGIPPNLTQYTLALFFGSGTIFGRIVPGILADHYGILNVMLAYTIVGGGLIFLMSRADTVGGFLAFTLLYGPCGGVLPSLFPASVGCYTSNRSEYGLRLGIGCVLYGIGSLIGGPINGALLRAPSYDWESAIIFSAVTVLGGSIALIASREILVKKKGTQLI